MYKLSQRELLEEGFWDSFKKGYGKLKDSKVGRLAQQLGQGVKEVANVVAPNTMSQAGNMIKSVRSAGQRIKQAGLKIEERILDWMDEQGIVPIPNDTVKLGKNTPKGQHYVVKVAQKGINKEGDTVPGKKFRYPQAIVLFDREKNIFEWVIKPRSDQFVITNGEPEYWNDSARPENQ